MTKKTTWVDYALCPAPVPTTKVLNGTPINVCLNRLPCEEHNVTNPLSGSILYGHTFIERYHPPRPWWRRIFGRAG